MKHHPADIAGTIVVLASVAYVLWYLVCCIVTGR